MVSRSCIGSIRDTLICTFPLLLLILVTIRSNHAILAYTLDDPYIHLELAKNIFNGNYGINEHEFSSPSSSIIWPFILAPLSTFAWYIYAPLFLNYFFLCLALALMLTHVFNEISSTLIRILVVSLFAFAFNLYGLPLTGMEHSLQALCSIVIAIGLFDDGFRQKYVKSFYFFLVLAPLVRYESLAITVPTILYLLTFRADRRYAILSAVVLFAFIGAFSLFLFFQSGYFFPSSVMIKQSAVSDSNATSLVVKLIQNIYSNISKYGWFIAIFGFTLYVTKTNKKLTGVYFSIVLLYLLLGKHGWFGRYEVFFVLFVAVSIFLLCKENFTFNTRTLTIGVVLLPFTFGSLVFSTLLSPLASSNIYNQQYLVSQVVKELDQPVAVNDLGLIAFYSDKPVVDLWGLGSISAMVSRKSKDRGYVARLMSDNNTNFAIIYKDWFDKQELENLILTAELTLNEMRITPAESTVTFYANSSANSLLLREKLKAFNFGNNILRLAE